MDIERLKGATCPDCNGGGVYQEYDEYDRYTVHSCATCDGSGEIARQSVTSEEVQRAIDWLESLSQWHVRRFMSSEIEWQEEPGASDQMVQIKSAFDLAIAALQAYQPEPPKGE